MFEGTDLIVNIEYKFPQTFLTNPSKFRIAKSLHYSDHRDLFVDSVSQPAAFDSGHV